MSRLNVKNGTPTGNAHLCRSCTWAQFITGYRESDQLAICTATAPNIVVPFTVYECSGYADKHKPDWEQMKKLAINLHPVRVSAKTRGFSVVETIRPAKTQDANKDKDEAARRR
jgi:hypothetical protein